MVGCDGDGRLLAVLGRSCGPCVRSWAVLGASVGGLGSLDGPRFSSVVPIVVMACSALSGNRAIVNMLSQEHLSRTSDSEIKK